MADPRLDTAANKINRFFGRLFEDEDAQRLAEPSVLNNFGTSRYLAEIRRRKELQRLYDRSNGQFCLGEALKLNMARFLFQWVDAFHGITNNIEAVGRSMSRTFGSVFTGGAINAAMFVGASHYAGNRAFKDDGICLARFWIYNQLALLAATPVVFLSHSLLHTKAALSSSFYSAVSPHRLMFNASYSLAIGLHNSNNSLANLGYYPLIVLSGVLLRASEGVANGAPAEIVTTNMAQLKDPHLSKSQAFGFVRANVLAIAAFCALNFIFPITLTQAKGKRGYEKAYFDYLDGKSESD